MVEGGRMMEVERIILRIVGDVLEIRKLDGSPMLNGKEVVA